MQQRDMFYWTFRHLQDLHSIAMIATNHRWRIWFLGRIACGVA